MAVMTAIQTGMEQNEYKVAIQTADGWEWYDALIDAIDKHNYPETDDTFCTWRAYPYIGHR